MDDEEKASSCASENNKNEFKRKAIIEDMELNMLSYTKEYANLVISTYVYRVAIMFHSM